MAMRQPHTALRYTTLVITVPVLLLSAWWLLVYDNYHVVAAGQFYRSGQMTASQFRRHADRDGFLTVINLRPETNEVWHAREMEECIKRGINLIDCPMQGDTSPTLKQMGDLVALMKKSSRPILIHCQHGADRTGLAVALYLLAIGNQTEEDAHKALSLRYGHLPIIKKSFDHAFEEFSRN